MERFNRTLLSLLRNLPENKKERWKGSLTKICMLTVRCRSNDVTGFSPFFLLFCWSPRVPVDLMFGLSRDEPSLAHQGYAEKRQIAMKEAYSPVAKNILKSTAAGKKWCHRKVRFSELTAWRSSPGE